MLLTIPLASSIDYLDEFSMEGRNCIYIDEFSYETTYSIDRATIVGCCDIHQCFYFPVNNEKQTLFADEFQEVMQIESARQNIFKHDLSEDVFTFIGYFSFCQLIDVEPVENQAIGGIVDITDKSLPYLISADKAKDFHQTVKLMKSAKLISKFDVASFALSATCSFGEKKDSELLEILSKGHNSFVNIKSGNTHQGELSGYDNFINELKIEAQQKEGLWGDLTEIFYVVSSLVTGGDIVKFSRDRMPQFEKYQSLFYEDIVNMSYSVNKVNEYHYNFIERQGYFTNSLYALKKNIAWWERFKAFFGFDSEVTKRVKMLSGKSDDVLSLKKNYQYKSANNALSNLFIELNTTYQLQKNLNYSIKQEIICQNKEIPYEYIEEVKQLHWEIANKSELSDIYYNSPNVEYGGAQNLGCQLRNCSLILNFNTGEFPVRIDYNATVIIWDNVNKTNLTKNISLVNIDLKENGDHIQHIIQFDKDYYNIKIVNIINNSIQVKENEYHTFKIVPYVDVSQMPINETRTAYIKQIYCYNVSVH